jgi:hypothetical protein
MDYFNKGEKKMNFIKAKEKLAKLANGKYHTIQYDLTEFNGGVLTQTCSVYIDGYKFHKAPNWYEALLSLQRQVKPTKVKIESIEEISLCTNTEE